MAGYKDSIEADGAKVPIGERRWAIAEGYIPGWSNGPGPEMVSHEAFTVLNAGDEDVSLEVTVYFEDREPIVYSAVAPARRSLHKRFNELDDPEPIPSGLGFGSVIEADGPVVVQHTRLDSRQSANALMTTIAYPDARDEMSR